MHDSVRIAKLAMLSVSPEFGVGAASALPYQRRLAPNSSCAYPATETGDMNNW